MYRVWSVHNRRTFVPWNLLNNLFSTIWDSFHGGASPSYDLFDNVTDGQNANTELITLYTIVHHYYMFNFHNMEKKRK